MGDFKPEYVVIDAEDREQAERLAKALVEAAFKHGNLPVAHNGIHGDTVQAALREFANPKPPRIDEPAGLGAVAEDAEGRRWVYCGPGKYPWARCVGGYDGDWSNWESIDAVRVLSEGVLP